MKERGFTLLEVMISVAISAIAIVSVLELFAGSTRLASLSVSHTEALVVARSKLDEFLWLTELDDGESSGAVGPYDYRIRIEPLIANLGVPAEGAAPEPESDDYELKRIDVVVSWPTPAGERSVALSTARIVEVF